VVDIGRAPYRTRARLYPGGPEFTIDWYVALDSAPPLPFPSAINNLEWEVDREEWLPVSVGEIYGAPREWILGAKKPLANGRHQCGTEADFGGAGVYDPLSPPVVYRNDGLPMCCGPGAVATGGAVGGGSATVAYTGPTGGAVGGGSATVAYTGPTGGAVGGGSATVGYGTSVEGSGGAVGGGSATVGYGTSVEGSGGAVGGGSATVEYLTPEVGSGGAVGGGTAEVEYLTPVEGSGGAVGGGTAEVEYLTPVEGSGGAVGGGSATVGYGTSVEGSGGAVGGGSATVEYTPASYGCDTYRVDWDGSDWFPTRTTALEWVDGNWVLTADGAGEWWLVNAVVGYSSSVPSWDGTGLESFGNGGTASDATVECADIPP